MIKADLRNLLEKNQIEDCKEIFDIVVDKEKGEIKSKQFLVKKIKDLINENECLRGQIRYYKNNIPTNYSGIRW